MSKVFRLVAAGAVALAALQSPVPTHARTSVTAVHTVVIPGASGKPMPTSASLHPTHHRVLPDFAATAGGITRFPLTPSINARPQGVASAGGFLFVVDNNQDIIEKINPTTGAVVATTATSFAPNEITTDGLGNLYVSESGGVEEFDAATVTSQHFTFIPAFVQGIVVEPAAPHNVDVTLPLPVNTVCVLSADLSVSQCFTGGPTFDPQYITTDGVDLYVTDSIDNAVVQMDFGDPTPITGFAPFADTFFAIPNGAANPQGITFNPAPTGDGNIWFTEEAASKVASLNPSTGAITEFLISSLFVSNYGPFQITPGPDGKLYFTSDFDGRPGSISPVTSSGPGRPVGNRITLYTLNQSFHTWGITTGPDNNIWFTENDNNTLDVLGPSYALTGKGITFSATTTAPLTNALVGTFSDENTVASPPDTYTLSINWGDGTAPSVGSYTQPGAAFVFNALGSHQYSKAGSFVVTITVTASDGRVATIFSRAIVTGPGATPTPTPTNTPIPPPPFSSTCVASASLKRAGVGLTLSENAKTSQGLFTYNGGNVNGSFTSRQPPVAVGQPGITGIGCPSANMATLLGTISAVSQGSFFMVGDAYSLTITKSGGVGSFSLSVTRGGVPLPGSPFSLNNLPIPPNFLSIVP